ncbi:MAG: hypothetical protein ACWA41_10930 [Putridiphycobacter sp.]
MRLLILIILATVFSFHFSCKNQEVTDNSQENYIDEIINIRKIPFTYSKKHREKKDNIIFFAIESSKKEADLQMIDSVERFICVHVLDTINLEDYAVLTLQFLKETWATKKIKDVGISDSNNPLSSLHYRYLVYRWHGVEFDERNINDGDKEKIEFGGTFNCDSTSHYIPPNK